MITALTLALGAFLVVVGATHFLFPRYYVRLVPPWLAHSRLLVLASGACEIVIGAALWIEPTRTLAGWAGVGLMGVYVLTHVDALGRSRSDSQSWLERPTGAIARVVVNLAYLAWALVVAVG